MYSVNVFSYQKAKAFAALKRNGINTRQFKPVRHHPYCVYDMRPTCRDEPFPTGAYDTVSSNYRQAKTLVARIARQKGLLG